jgi:Raf kinase inhibitor-like YbhB/YbcL family protein
MVRARVALGFVVGCGSAASEPKGSAPGGKEAGMGFTIKTAAFPNEGTIPKKFTGDGPDVSPALEWSGAPAGTRAYALIMDDPDAPVGTWVHWVIYDIPATQASLPEGLPKQGGPSTDASQGRNSWANTGYQGPAPPPGKPHRYHFKLYALSAPTGLAPGADKGAVERAIKGKVLAVATWIGRYGR